MRSKIDELVLETAVFAACDELDSFSFYDITKVVRSRHPTKEIEHEAVKDLVSEYLQDIDYRIEYKAGYRFFTKVSSVVPNNVIRQPVSRLSKLLDEKTKGTTTQVAQNSKPLETLNLQTEQRVNLTEMVKKYFPGNHMVYLAKEPNKITISNTSFPESSLYDVANLRIRTGFTGSKIKVMKNVDNIVLTPL